MRDFVLDLVRVASVCRKLVDTGFPFSKSSDKPMDLQRRCGHKTDKIITASIDHIFADFSHKFTPPLSPMGSLLVHRPKPRHNT